MNFIRFFVSGPNSTKLDQFSQEYYDKNNKDTVIATNTTHTYIGNKDFDDGTGFYPDTNDRKTWRSEYLIDGAVKVNTVHIDVIRDAKAFWAKMQKVTKIVFTVTLIVGLCAIGGAIAAGILLGWPVAVAISAIALVALGLTALSAYRISQTSNETQEWKANDTVEKAINERRAVGVQGFNYAFAKNLKGKIVTSEELKDLWYKEVQGYNQMFNSGAHSSTIRSFMERSPFALEAVDYAHDKSDSDYAILKNFNTHFENYVRPIYSRIRSETIQQEAAVNNERFREIGVVEQQCNSEVSMMKEACKNATSSQNWQITGFCAARMLLSKPSMPFLDPNDRNSRRKMQEYHNQLMTYNSAYNGLSMQIDALNSEVLSIESDYNMRIASIEAKYSSKKIKINSDADHKLSVIKGEEDRKLVASLSSPIKDLLQKFNNRNNSQPKVEVIQQSTEPSAPELGKYAVDDLSQQDAPPANAPPPYSVAISS